MTIIMMAMSTMMMTIIIPVNPYQLHKEIHSILRMILKKLNVVLAF